MDIVDTASGEAAVVMRKHDAAAARTMALAIVRSTVTYHQNVENIIQNFKLSLGHYF
jgi:hypothetical protein